MKSAWPEYTASYAEVPSVTVVKFPVPPSFADDLLQRFDFAGITEPGVRLPVEITWARDVRTIRLHADAGGVGAEVAR